MWLAAGSEYLEQLSALALAHSLSHAVDEWRLSVGAGVFDATTMHR